MITPKPVVANRLSNDNVNIAMIRGTPLKSHDCIQIQDKSITYPDNLLSVFTGAVQTNANNSGVLSFPNCTNDILITNQALYIYREGRRVPMWYQYIVSERYHSTTARFGNITKANVTGGIEYMFVPQTSDETIARNSVVVKYSTNSTGPWTTIASTNYVLDLGRRSVILIPDTYNGKYIKISFYALKHDISIVDEEEDVLPSDSFMIILDKYKTTPGDPDEFTEDTVNPLLNALYMCTIYLKETPQVGEKLTVMYRTIDENNVSEEREEIINPYPIYEEVSSLTTPIVYDRNDMKYTVNSSFVISTKLCSYDTIYIQQIAKRNSKIGLIEPEYVTHDQLWFVEVANQETTINGYDYRLLEEDSHIRTNGYIVQEHTENAQMIAPGKIKTKYNNVLSIRNGSGFSGIWLATNGSDMSSFISDIDSKNGMIYLRGEFPFDHENTTITYRTFHKYAPYAKLCLNAYRIFDQISEYIIDKYAVIYMLPETELNTAMGRSIFHLTVYKHPELLFDPVPTYKMTTDGAISFIEDLDDLGKSNLYTLIPEYINGTAGDVLHPIILGVISVTPPITASSMKFIDVRRRGGGMSEAETYLEHLEAEIRHNLDIAHWNAFEYNLENIAIVRVPRVILSELIDLMTRYDADTIRALRKDPNYDVNNVADAYIRNEVKRYLRAGCHFTVEFSENI